MPHSAFVGFLCTHEFGKNAARWIKEDCAVDADGRKNPGGFVSRKMSVGYLMSELENSYISNEQDIKAQSFEGEVSFVKTIEGRGRIDSFRDDFVSKWWTEVI